MKHVFILLTAVFSSLAFSAAAQSGEQQVRIGECHGEQFAWVDNTMTPTEIGILFPHLQVMPEGERILMRFEANELGGERYYHWGDMSDDYLVNNYCADARYRQNEPLPGKWLFEPVSVDLSGCPEGASPATAMTRTMDLTWEDGFDPDEILADFRLPFETEVITLSHRTARVNAIPNLPGEVLIAYDFYLVSKSEFTVKAELDLTIPSPGGGAPTRCFGTFEMVATHQG